ncbi:hypothetical protein RQP46_000519 [Phenoliferia psychrophenolica]
MAPGDVEDPADPFPLFCLASLDFSPADLSSLSSAQLALVQFFPSTTEHDLELKTNAMRIWRRRRESARATHGTTARVGVFASSEEREQERWPLFELIDLNWKIDGVESLQQRSSAELAALQFHPDATKEIIHAAEEAYFARRERAFNAGYILQPHSSDLIVTASTNLRSTTPKSSPPASHSAALAASHSGVLVGSTTKRTQLTSYQRSDSPWRVEDVVAERSPHSPRRSGGPLIQAPEGSVTSHREYHTPAGQVLSGQLHTGPRAPETNAGRDEAAATHETSSPQWGGRGTKRPLPDVFDDFGAFRRRIDPSGLPPVSREAGTRNRDHYREREPPHIAGISSESSSKYAAPIEHSYRPPNYRNGSAQVATNFGTVGADSDVSPNWGCPTHGDDKLPRDLVDKLSVIHIRNISKDTHYITVRDLLLRTHRVSPVGIRLLVSSTKASGRHQDVEGVSVLYLLAEDAEAVVRRLDRTVHVGSRLDVALAGKEHRDELPSHLISSLSQLFLSNLPLTVSLNDLRDFFDDFDGIVGIGVGPPHPRCDSGRGWLAFESDESRTRCQLSLLKGVRLPSVPIPLFVEDADDRTAKLVSYVKKAWSWEEMTKVIKAFH